MPLTTDQLRGISAGLTQEQVNHDWFSYAHAQAAEASILYNEYQGLSYTQVEYGILKGLKREQVDNITCPYKLQGMVAGLNQEQVNNDWFSYGHAQAAEQDIDYETYNGFSNTQGECGILKGLKREQVAGLNYNQIVVMRRYQLPDATILKDIQDDGLLEQTALEYLQKRSERYTFATCHSRWAHTKDPSETLGVLSKYLVRNIGEYL